MKHLFFSLTMALACCACTATQKPKTRWLNCYVRYLEAERQVRAEATLKEGDTEATAAPAQFAGELRYQGEALRALPTGASNTYLKQEAGTFVPEHVFSWDAREGKTDKAGSPQQFALQMASMQDFTFGSDTISRQRAATFRWRGPALQKGESLVFFWENLTPGAKEQSHPMEIYGVGSTTIDFPAAKFAELTPGRWSLYLVRKKVTNAEIANVRATGMTEYFTRTDTLLVE